MKIDSGMLANIIVGVFFCGAYLQYRGFKVMQLVPTIADRKERSLSRNEILTLIASAAYFLLGTWFEGFSLIHALP